MAGPDRAHELADTFECSIDVWNALVWSKQRLAVWLAAYGQHRDDCTEQTGPTGDCPCGWTSIRKELPNR